MSNFDFGPTEAYNIIAEVVTHPKEARVYYLRRQREKYGLEIKAYKAYLTQAITNIHIEISRKLDEVEEGERKRIEAILVKGRKWQKKEVLAIIELEGEIPKMKAPAQTNEKEATVLDTYKDLISDEVAEWARNEAPENVRHTDKVRYLHLLGVLDFLRDKEPSSINSLAEVLAPVLGMKVSTLVSNLNPIFSPGTAQGNNPLNNEKRMQKVRSQLIEKGFTPSK